MKKDDKPGRKPGAKQDVRPGAKQIPIRINKYLSQQGVCSRREADRLVESGAILVNGQRALVGQEITAADEILLNGNRIAEAKKEIFLAVNKPRGVVVTTDSRWDDKTLEAVVNYPSRVFAVGRLDKESEGLILMTNNGDISNLIQKSKENHEKEYIVTVDRKITKEFILGMSDGVYLKELDQTTKKCRVKKLDHYSFDIILTEGLNRQIRRMCEVFDYKVRRLKRIRVMNIELGNLPAGAYRELAGGEIRELKKLVKGQRNQ